MRSDTYLKTWNAIPPQRPPVFPAFLSRLTRQGAIDRYRRDGAQKRGAREYLLSLEELGDAVGGEADEALDARLLAESIERYLRTPSPAISTSIRLPTSRGSTAQASARSKASSTAHGMVCAHIWNRRALRYDKRTAQRFPQLSW